MLKKIMITMLAAGTLFAGGASAQTKEKPEITGEYGVAIDAISGEVLYEKNANEKANPASITKIMTAILLDENANPGEMIQVSENARHQECSCFVFEEGESISKENALNAMMIVSANDLAMAIAEHIGGSQEEFGKMMTKKAHELGAVNTTFTSPSGLTAPEHKTTAYDMALIAKEALEHPNVIAAMGMEKATIQTSTREKIVVHHGSALDDPMVIAAKTGWTTAAGHTLVSILEKDHKKVISVVLKSSKQGKYTDVITMGKYALEQIDTKRIIEEDEKLGEVKVGGEKIELYATEGFDLTYNVEKENTIETKVKERKGAKEVKVGEKMGTVEIYYDGEPIKEIDLVTKKEVVKKEEFQWNKILIGFLIPIPFYIYYVIRYNKRKKERLKEEKAS